MARAALEVVGYDRQGFGGFGHSGAPQHRTPAESGQGRRQVSGGGARTTRRSRPYALAALLAAGARPEGPERRLHAPGHVIRVPAGPLPEGRRDVLSPRPL